MMKNSLKFQKQCEQCGMPFNPRLKTSRFCSKSCWAKYRYSPQNRAEVRGHITSSITPDTERKIGTKTQPKPAAQKRKTGDPQKRSVIKAAVPAEKKLETISAKPFLNISEAALLLGISRTTLYTYLKAGELEFMRMGSKTFISQKSIYSKFGLINLHHSQPTQTVSPILEYYTLDGITEKFGVTTVQAKKVIRMEKIPSMTLNGVATYSKPLIDVTFSKSEPEPKLSEWYSVNDIKQRYGMKACAILQYCTYHNIPKMNQGRSVFYSRRAFDKARKQLNTRSNKKSQQLVPKNEHYYSTAEAIEILGGIDYQVLYYQLRKNKIPTKKEGRSLKISGPEFDKAFPVKRINA